MDKPVIVPPVSTGPAPTVILHVKLWYRGLQGEMNLISPNLIWIDYAETQYLYIRQYLRKVGVPMGLEAYQASICYPRPDGTVKVFAQYAKVIFTPDQGFANDQYFEDCQKGGANA